MRRFAVLDRDGTIVMERRYLARPDQVELIPGASNGLRALQEAGLGLVVATNQSGIGRGYFDWRQLELIHRRLEALLAEEGVELEAIYCCPHTPEDRCECRKPRTGLMERAARELGFQAEDSFVIGDKVCDVEFGRRAGATTFLVKTGYGAAVAAQGPVAADYVVNTLADAVPMILAKVDLEQSREGEP